MADFLGHEGAQLGHYNQELRQAIGNRDVHVVKMFFDHGAEAKAISFLKDAIKRQSPEIVQMLLEKGASAKGCKEYAGYQPLSHAVEVGNYKSCQILLEEGALAD